MMEGVNTEALYFKVWSHFDGFRPTRWGLALWSTQWLQPCVQNLPLVGERWIGSQSLKFGMHNWLSSRSCSYRQIYASEAYTARVVNTFDIHWHCCDTASALLFFAFHVFADRPISQNHTPKNKWCALDMETLSTVGTTTSETVTTEQTDTSIFTAEMTTGRNLILCVYVYYA